MEERRLKECAPSFTLTSSQQSLRLFYMKKSESGVDRPLGRGKSRRQMKKAPRKLSLLKSEPAAQVAFEVRVMITCAKTSGSATDLLLEVHRLNSHQPLGLNTRFTLVDYYVNAQSLCFQEGKKYSNSQTDVQITLITRLQGFRFNFRSFRHINTDR